jgi:hypothetical protein
VIRLALRYDSTMSDAAKKLLDEALGLPPEDRRELAVRLMDSVRDHSEHTREARWQRLRSAAGCVHLGGHALNDTEALYDG